jgi:hypothetical protein
LLGVLYVWSWFKAATGPVPEPLNVKRAGAVAVGVSEKAFEVCP